MFSNISYFSKSGDQQNLEGYHANEPSSQQYMSNEPSQSMEFQSIEPDSTSKHYTASLNLPESVRKFAARKVSLSDSDLLSITEEGANIHRGKKKLKLDIRKASQSMNESLSQAGNTNIENTPPHINLDCKSADLFSEKFKQMNFSRSFVFDMSSDSEEELDIESLSDCSDTDISAKEEEPEVKMCRKVESSCENQLVPSATPESFGDMELDRNEEERVSLLLNYQMKFEKIECVLKKLLSEFQFHIEVSKIFNGRSFVTALSGTDVSNIPKMLGQVKYMDNIHRDSPTDSWNIVMEKEDAATKFKFRKQLQSLKHCVDNFTATYLQSSEPNIRVKPMIKRSITFNLHKGKRMHKSMKISNKKRMKHFDFPDYRDSLLNLFKEGGCDGTDTHLDHTEDGSAHQCACNCHNHSLSQSDSGLTSKENLSNQSITSSIGNFSLDSTTLSAFSESLDQIISYNSFEDSTLFSTLQQKPAVERITFYVQAHSIQIRSDTTDKDDSKITISFFCPSCDITENEEDGLLRHILCQKHCEKIHFQYKSAYIKKCMEQGREIQPSTVLNPMKMYRDDNKIVCFGDAVYACSLCFENNIVGESILMAHCADETHADRREKMYEMYE